MKRTPLKRKTRLSPVSKKRRGMARARKETRELVLERDMNRCQANIHGCSYHATDVHEIKSRARGGNIIAIDGDLSNFLSLCRSCHSYITTHPEFSQRNGFSVGAYCTPAELRAAERARAIFNSSVEIYEVDDE